MFLQPEGTLPKMHDPQLAAIMIHLKYQYSDYKYTVYRCAAKIVGLQKVFHTAKIPYRLMLAVLERQPWCSKDANVMVPPFQLQSLIRDIYFACENLGHFSKIASYQLEPATTVLTNFFWNVYDPNRRHSVSLLEIKVTFILLCKLFASDQLVPEFYNLLHDAKSKCVSRLTFECLLNILSKFLTYIGEGNGYGAHNCPVIMEQCFARCQHGMGLTEQQFNCLWSITDTQFLIYANLVALIKRLEDTEKLVHSNACASCHVERIIGIRFKCQACKNLSLCLKCFATGYAANRHEAGHRMCEVFTEDLPAKKISHYFAKLCDLFCSAQHNNSSEETKGFCSSNDTCVSANDTVMMTIAKNETTTRAIADGATAGATSANEIAKPSSANAQSQIHVKQSLAAATTNAQNVSERLQSLIDRLLQQNSKLETQLKLVQTATPQEICYFLSSHQQFLVGVINEMRSFGARPAQTHAQTAYLTASTPYRAMFTIPNGEPSSLASSAIAACNQPTDGNLTHSLYGADINRTYIEANRSDYSLRDVSVWFSKDPRRRSMPNKPLLTLKERSFDDHVEMRETEMSNFRLLLRKVKEILEDSYSDNSELAAATQNLENVLDCIIKGEESRRMST